MPFSSGTFSRVYNWVADKNNSINITASRMDTETDGIATGLSTCMLKDGTQTVTADIPFSGFKLTGIGNATLVGDAANLGQVQAGKTNWVVAGGAADAITAAYSPAITALVDGMELNFRASAANATTTPTFSPNGLTARTITQQGGTALVAGSIPGALAECTLRYNLANTRWEILNPISSLAPFIDSTAIIRGSADATKLLKIEVDGLTTGTTRTLTAQDANGTIALTATTVATVKKQAFTANGTYTPTTGMIYCIVELVGGGGGGGGSATGDATSAGGGGGGGGYSRKICTAADIGASKTVTIGAGGTAGAADGTGGTGGTTSLGSLLQATGGTGGTVGGSGGGNPGVGGAGSTGDFNAVGNAGTSGSSTDSFGGSGGGSFFGGGAPGNTIATGTAGSSYGGGGSGGSGATRTGGAGAAGYMFITEFCNA